MIKSNKGFYVGDICYVLQNNIYNDIWAEIGFPESLAGIPVLPGKEVDGVETTETFNFAVKSTGGDGVFFDNEGYEYSVDAGVIGVVPLELCYQKGLNKGLGRILDIAGNVEFGFDAGIISVSVHSVDGRDNNPVEVFEIDIN